MGTANMHKNLVKFGRVVFELYERTDKQTNGQTDILNTILRTPSRGGGRSNNQDLPNWPNQLIL